MILVLAPGLPADAVTHVERSVRAAGGDPKRLSSDQGIAIDAGAVDAALLGRPEGVVQILHTRVPYPRIARSQGDEVRRVRIGPVTIGDGSLQIVAGPCAVESEDQLESCAAVLTTSGVKLLRGGAFKPRSSPYSFQGMAREGLRLLREAADRHGLGVVTEVMEPSLVALVAEHADALQIGSRNMQNFALLRAVGQVKTPVILKRGMSATLEEWLLAAEYIVDAGNPDVILCERGVRSFDPAARNLLDLAAVPLLRERSNLPIMVDPSHGVGVRRAIPAAARAAVAIGADAIMIEIHPEPGRALSDGFQAIPTGELAALVTSLHRVRAALEG